MNLISIPPDPTGPGCVSVRIEIGRADIRSTVALLQNARHLLERDGLPASRACKDVQPEQPHQAQATPLAEHIPDQSLPQQTGRGQAPTQCTSSLPAKMYHLFPAESSRASDISISRSSHSAAPQAATSFTHDTQIEQQHPQQVEATPDEPDQQQPEEVVSPQAASTQEPAGWVSPNQQSQQLLQQPQAQLQRELEDSFQQGNRISYGETAGYQDKWIGTSGKRAGKQLLATKGTRPITINHMSWEVPEGSPTPAEEEAVVQPQPGRGRPRQSKLGTKPTPRSQQRQLSPQTETSPPSLPQPGNALPHPGNALPQPGNALSRSGSVSAQPRSASSQPDGIPPHLPAAASQSPPAASAHSAAALSHASSALQASYSQGNAQQPRHNVQLDSSVNWQRMWTTEAADHSGDVVTTCLHLASMTDLPDNGEHAGYLVSASRNLLNLWQCSCSFDEPALQLVHCLDTEFHSSDLQLDPANNLLLAAAKDTKATTECVAVHHLRLTPGIFRLNGRLGLPAGVSGPSAKNPNAPVAMQVQAVHHYEGTLTGCCAASCGGQIAIYPSKVVPGELATPKGSWNAHASTITALHAGTFQSHLLSGDENGFIHGWNVRTKPSQPIYKMKHKSAVTGLVATSEFSVLSCSTDSHIAMWDIRNHSKPVNYMTAPDGRPILKMSAQLGKRNLAFSTTSGIYAVNLDSFGKVQCVSTADAGQTLALAWNIGSTGQTYLYTAGGATISAYRAS